MALLLIENFVDFAFADIDSECTSRSGGDSIVAGPRANCKALYINNSSHYVEYAIAPSAVVRFALRLKLVSGTGDRALLGLMEGSNLHVTIGVDGSGYLRAWRTSSLLGTVLATASTDALTVGTWYQVEGRVEVSDTTGSIELRVNGNPTPVINLSGADTRDAATGVVSALRVGAPPLSSGPSWQVTDLAVWNESGESPTGWVGDVRVDTLTVTGAGSSTAWTPSAGSNYQCVDEANVDGDTTYIESGTNAEKDLYTVSNLLHSPATVHAVAVTAKARKTDAGSGSIKLAIKSGATEAQSASQSLSDASYARYVYARGVDPATSSAWTPSGVNAIEAGVESVI